MRARWALLPLATCALLACKEKQEQAPAAAPKPPASTSPADRPSLPSATDGSAAPASASEKKPVKPISVAEATAALPAIDGTQVIGLKQTTDQGQVHGTWCIDGTSADDVAKKVGQWLAQAKYSGITIRGDARKAGVMADRDGMRLSMVVSASSARVCAAPAHYFASATIFRL